MNDETLKLLGTTLPGPRGRDAVHVAVAAVQAGSRLRPGQHIGFLCDGTGKVGGANNLGLKTIGIVDPFLTKEVEEDQWFFIFLYPGTITGLRHVFTHPAFVSRPPE